MVARLDAAMTSPQRMSNCTINSAMPIGTVFLASPVRSTLANRYSFQERMKPNRPVERMPGSARGSTIRTKAPSRPFPSTMAASSRASGIVLKNDRNSQRQKGAVKVICVTITPAYELMSPSIPRVR